MRRHHLRTLLALGSLAIATVIPVTAAYAYGTDVHFNLSYVECRLAGFSYRDALWVALADESIDHNRTTSSYNGTADTVLQFFGLHRYIWARNGQRWQAYTDEGAPNSALDGVLTSTHYNDLKTARAAVAARRDILWNAALDALAHETSDRSSAIRADITLGLFLHFEQDMYAHRQFGADLDGQNWAPFGTFRGHSAEGYSPDYVALRPQLAREMTTTVYGYLQQWQARRSAKASDLSAALVASLVSHISTAYDPRALQYPQHRFRPWFPAQRALDQQLSAALTGSAYAREWANALPNANDMKFELPYDSPATPLRDVERRVGEPATADPRVQFAQVLPAEIVTL